MLWPRSSTCPIPEEATQYMSTISYNKTVNMLVFLLPLMSLWITHAASTILILLCMLGIGVWLSREKRIFFTWSEKAVMVSFAAILGMGLLSVPLHWISADIYQSDFQYDHELKLLAFIPIYYLFVHTKIKSETFWYGLCAGAIFAGVWSCVLSYILGTSERIAGAYNPILVGDMAVAMGFAGLAGVQFFEKKHKATTLIPLVAVLMGMTAAFISATRAALMAAPLLLVVFWIQIGKHPKAWRLRSLVFGLIIIVALSGYYFSDSNIDKRVRTGLQTMAETLNGQPKNLEDATDFSTAAHFRLWKEAIGVIGEHPWIGVGDDGFGHIIREKSNTDPSIKPIMKYDSTHNMYLQFMVIHGIPGLPVILALYIFPLVYFINWIRRSDEVRDVAYAGVAVVLSYMQFSLTESIMGRSVPIALYVVLIAAAMSLCRKSGTKKSGAD